jgi:hypothetical protein
MKSRPDLEAAGAHSHAAIRFDVLGDTNVRFGRTSGLSRVSVVPRPGSEGQSLALCGRLSVGKGCVSVLRG